jgi:hypothetical protein
MNKIQEIPYSEMLQLESEGTHGFHGTPILPELLESYHGVPEGSLMPLHAPRNYNRQTGLHQQRTPGRLACVSFFGRLAPASARGLFNAANHTTLPPVDCLSGCKIDENNDLHLKSTEPMYQDTIARGVGIQAAVYTTELKNLERSPDDPYDYWSVEPVQPEYVARINGTQLTHLASLCVSGQIEIIPSFQPNFNNC